MELREVDISEIRIPERYRTEYGDMESLADSIQEKGLLQPITLDQNYRLVAGGRRLEAVKSLGWEAISAIIRQSKDEIDLLEVELIENIARKDLRWDERARLEKEIFDQRSEKDPGWQQKQQSQERGISPALVNRRLQLAEAMELLPDLKKHDTEEAAWKEYKKLEEDFVNDVLVKKAKEDPRFSESMRQAEEHYIVGDAVAELSAYDGPPADFAEVDPPYAVDLNTLRTGRNKDKSQSEHYNEIEDTNYLPFITEVANLVYRILKPDTYCVWWHGSIWAREVLDTLRAAGFEVNPVPAIWYKGPVGQSSQPDVALASCFEPFYVARKGKPKLHRAGRVNVFHHPPVPPQHKIHSTEKPPDLMDDIVETFCFPGSTILCPFLGSGATLLAAYRLGHTGWGYDLSNENKKAFLRQVSKEYDDAE